MSNWHKGGEMSECIKKQKQDGRMQAFYNKLTRTNVQFAGEKSFSFQGDLTPAGIG
jgi:hypothetical protein